MSAWVGCLRKCLRECMCVRRFMPSAGTARCCTSCRSTRCLPWVPLAVFPSPPAVFPCHVLRGPRPPLCRRRVPLGLLFVGLLFTVVCDALCIASYTAALGGKRHAGFGVLATHETVHQSTVCLLVLRDAWLAFRVANVLGMLRSVYAWLTGLLFMRPVFLECTQLCYSRGSCSWNARYATLTGAQADHLLAQRRQRCV